MMLFVFSTIVMYLGVRLYLMGIGKIKKEISNNRGIKFEVREAS